MGVRVGTEVIVKDNTHGYTDFHCQTPSIETGIDKPEVVLSDYVIDYTRLNIDQRVLMERETDGYDFRYVYGLDLVNVKATGEGTDWWAQSVKKCVYSDYVHTDRLGSVVNLSDQFGRVPARIDYDDWGNVTDYQSLNISGGYRTILPEITYAGHQYDDVLNLFYAKARMYDADNRRFMAVDPVKGSVANPLTLVQYLYVIDNPLRYVDLDGQRYVESDPRDFADPKPVLKTPEPNNLAQMFVTTDSVRFRASPGLNGAILGVLYTGNSVIDLVETSFADNYRWRKVQFNGQIGWVAEKYLSYEFSSNMAQSAFQANEPVSEERPIDKDDTKSSIAPILPSTQDKPISRLTSISDFFDGLSSGIAISAVPGLGLEAQAAASVIDWWLQRPSSTNFYVDAILWANDVDKTSTANATDKQAFYAGRAVGDLFTLFAGTLQVLGGIEIAKSGAGILGAGAALTSTGDPVIGVPAIVAGAAVSVAGAAVSVGGTAIAAIAADNLGKDSGKFFDSFGCEDGPSLTPENFEISDKPMWQLGPHYNKHGREMGYASKKEYDAAAKEFARAGLKNPSMQVYSGEWRGRNGESRIIQWAITDGARTAIVDYSTGQIVDFYLGAELRGLIHIVQIR